MISTKGKAAWTEGRIEIRAKLPPAATADGLVPAGWMRPVDGGNGEIDIFELRTGEAENAGTMNQAIHHDYQGDVPHKENLSPATAQEGFHVYAVEWSADSIRWYIDDEQTWEVHGDTTKWLSTTFNRPFFLRLNMAVGPDWVGEPTAETALPATMAVDYVRVYDRGAGVALPREPTRRPSCGRERTRWSRHNAEPPPPGRGVSGCEPGRPPWLPRCCAPTETAPWSGAAGR